MYLSLYNPFVLFRIFDDFHVKKTLNEIDQPKLLNGVQYSVHAYLLDVYVG